MKTIVNIKRNNVNEIKVNCHCNQSNPNNLKVIKKEQSIRYNSIEVDTLIFDIKNALLIIVLLIALLTTQNSFASELLFCQDSAPPYTVGKNGTFASSGYLQDIANEINNRSELNIKILLLPWARCIKRLKDKSIDGIMLASKVNERMSFLTFGGVIAKEKGLVIYSTSGPKIKRWSKYEDISKYRISITRGYYYSKQFKNAKKQFNLKIIESNNDFNSIMKVIRKRADIAFVSEAVLKKFLDSNEDKKENLKISDNIYALHTYHYALSKKISTKESNKIIKVINQIIEDMKNDGTLRLINMKWIKLKK